jgi:hypothetical protein
MTTTKYKIRDLPLSIDDACRIEEAQETRSIRAIRPILERFVIQDETVNMSTIPLGDMADILTAILNRNGVGQAPLKS